jgi:predicted enzyme related to lactoylglutathione lyase
MKKVLIEIRVASLEEAKKFYCEELALFNFSQDFGMGEISLVYKENESILLFLSEGSVDVVERPIFSIEVDSCEPIFNRLKDQPLKSGAQMLNKEIFEYPLGKNITLKDPSENMFIIFSAY